MDDFGNKFFFGEADTYYELVNQWFISMSAYGGMEGFWVNVWRACSQAHNQSTLQGVKRWLLWRKKYADVCKVMGDVYFYNNKCSTGRILKFIPDLEAVATTDAEERKAQAKAVLDKLVAAGIKGVQKVQVRMHTDYRVFGPDDIWESRAPNRICVYMDAR